MIILVHILLDTLLPRLPLWEMYIFNILQSNLDLPKGHRVEPELMVWSGPYAAHLD